MAERVIRGEIELPTGGLPGRAKAIVVQVEDTSRADAPSEVVAEQRLVDVDLESGGRVPFEVSVDPTRLDQRGRYSVRAHVDMTGSGHIDVGDLITMQEYPVLTAGSEQPHLVVRRV